MGIRLSKPFIALEQASISEVTASLGVFELADEHGVVIFIGYAGGRSLFGLRGMLTEYAATSAASQFRYEVNSAYLTRYQELLMAHIADHGRLPLENTEADGVSLGRLS